MTARPALPLPPVTTTLGPCSPAISARHPRTDAAPRAGGRTIEHDRRLAASGFGVGQVGAVQVQAGHASPPG